MKRNRYTYILLLFAGIILTRCSTKNDVIVSDKLTDYMSLAPGKYITYRLDSTKFINFGQKDTTISYQAKDVIDAAITDNLGRPSWRVIRYLNDTLAQGTWNPDITYMITPTTNTMEVVENNLRFQKLKEPVINGYNWKGNTYINTLNSSNPYAFLDDWDYTYANHGNSFTPLNTAIPNTVTVNQQDTTLGVPGNLDSYSERNLAIEVYGKGIGLIYKNFLHKVFQPRNTTYPNGYYDGFGIKLRMIDHN